MDSERRKKILIVATLVCVGAWAADRIVVGPLLGAYQARADRIAELEADLAESEALLERAPSLEARWREMRDAALSPAASEAEQAVLQSVNAWASDSRFRLASIKPRWVTVDSEHRLLEVQVEGAGDMAALARFIYGLESDPLPLRVEELEIRVEDEAAGRLGLTARFSGLVLESSAA